MSVTFARKRFMNSSFKSKFCENKLFVVISNKVKEEINKLGKLSIHVARKPNKKKMIELIKEKFLLGKKIG